MYILSVLKMFPPICHSFLIMAPLFWTEFLWSLNFLSFFFFSRQGFTGLMLQHEGVKTWVWYLCTPKEELFWVLKTGNNRGRLCGLGRKYSLICPPACPPPWWCCVQEPHTVPCFCYWYLSVYGFFCTLLFIIVPTSMCAVIFSPL